MALATPKQVAYALALAKGNPEGWTKIAAGLGLGPNPTADDFQGLQSKVISSVIDTLKKGAMGAGPKGASHATPKQVGFALSLMLQLDQPTWTKKFLPTYGKPTSSALHQMPSSKLSALIDELLKAIKSTG